MTDMETKRKLTAAYDEVMAGVRSAEAEAGRPSGEVTLLAAVKYATAEQINILHRERGLCHVGENRVQTLLEHWEGLEDRENMKVHFIGSLQKNKVKYIVGKVCLIHSVDSFGLAEEIDRQSAKLGIVTDILVEVNIGNEESKTGADASSVKELCGRISGLRNVNLRGLMTVGPKCGSPEGYIGYFSQTYSLFSEIFLDKSEENGHNINGYLLSMGMSDSYVEAISCGADVIRPGRCLFGERNYPER